MRIVQLVNLVTERSGGIRTAVERLGAGYAAAGHERHVIQPGAAVRHEPGPGGTAWTLQGRTVPASGGYRVLLGRNPVRELLEQLAPDVVEVSDRWTLTWVAGWARTREVRSVALVHEHLAQTMTSWPRIAPRRADRAAAVADRAAAVADRRLADAFDAVVCGSRHSAAPFGGRATVVPLGVDLVTFHPDAAPSTAADAPGPIGVVVVGRLSAEKRPDLAIDAVRDLVARGVPVELTMIGDGPLRRDLAARSSGLPVRLLGHVADRATLVAHVAAADVAVAPCPIEAFGLAALEALACGTPVIGTGGGVRDLLADAPPTAGCLVTPDGRAIADAIVELAAHPRQVTRSSARGVAERYPWSRTVERMLRILAGDAIEHRATA